MKSEHVETSGFRKVNDGSYGTTEGECQSKTILMIWGSRSCTIPMKLIDCQTVVPEEPAGKGPEPRALGGGDVCRCVPSFMRWRGPIKDVPVEDISGCQVENP